MKNSIVVLLALLLVTACNRPTVSGSNQPDPTPGASLPKPAGSFNTQMTSGGVTRHFRVHVPMSYQEDVAAPLPVAGAYNFWKNCDPPRPVPVIAFHGLEDQIIPYTSVESQAMVPAIEEWAAAWARRNGCASTPNGTSPVDTVPVRTWSNCQQGAFDTFISPWCVQNKRDQHRRTGEDAEDGDNTSNKNSSHRLPTHLWFFFYFTHNNLLL